MHNYDIEFLVPRFPKFYNVKKYLGRSYSKNLFTNGGPVLQELDKKFKDYFDFKGEVIFVANGTLALILAYKYIGCKKALIPSFTFAATAQALHWAGIDYEFVDVHPTKWTISVDDLEEKIHKHKADLIVGVHSFGNPCAVQLIDRLAAINDCKIIYDAAPAISSFVTDDKKTIHISNYGHISCFSLHATKALQAGEGGAIFVKNKEIADKIRMAINFGFNEDRIPMDAFGTNAKLSEIHAGFAVCSLERLAFNQKERLDLVDIYKKRLQNYVTFQEMEDNCISTHQVLTVLLPKGIDRDKVIEKMAYDKIQCRKYYNPPLHKTECFKRDYSLPITEDICERSISLPLHLWMNQENVDRVCDMLIKNIGE
jgi:dTDP-4-amino-4,6-dideoxygalactose transaminase